MTQLRLILASAASLAAAALLTLVTLDKGSEPYTIWLLPALSALAPAMLRTKTFALQLLARTSWASTVVLVLPWVAYGDANPVLVGAMGMSAFALVVAGGHGLAGTGFAPVAYRRSILGVSVLLGTLVVWTAAFLGNSVTAALAGQPGVLVIMGGLTLVLGSAVLGMVRLKVWGFVLAGVSSTLLCALLALCALGAPTGDGAGYVLGALAGMLAAPVAVAAAVLFACLRGARRAR